MIIVTAVPRAPTVAVASSARAVVSTRAVQVTSSGYTRVGGNSDAPTLSSRIPVLITQNLHAEQVPAPSSDIELVTHDGVVVTHNGQPVYYLRRS